MKEPYVIVTDTTLAVWRAEQTEALKDYAAVLKFLPTIGFKHHQCEHTAKHYASLAKDHRRAEHGRLKAKINRSGRSLKLEFYQTEVTVNPNGGEYDFSKLEKMPYLIRLRFLWARERLLALFQSRGLPPLIRKSYEAGDSPLEVFNDGWTAERFARDANGWPDERELRSWDRKDGDGVIVNQGDTRFVQSYKARYRWSRCQVFGGINGMWHCFSHGRLIDNVNVGALRSVFPGRGRRPHAYHRRDAIQRRLNKAVEEKRYLEAHRLQEALRREAA